MIKRILPLLVGLAVCGAAAAQTMPASQSSSTTRTTTTITTWRPTPPVGALTENDVKTAIANAGYKEVKGLEFKNGVWRSKARGGNDRWVKIAVGPVNGKVYPADAPSRLSRDEIAARLAAAGYENVDDIDFDDGLWSAEAKTAHGDDVDLLVDPNNGSVIARSRD
ncbi:MAG TPA: PepSY domain-containing protein [Rhodanobacter sp.]|nr:PepSY domain-containing protein [Rhodanobacter sp.]